MSRRLRRLSANRNPRPAYGRSPADLGRKLRIEPLENRHLLNAAPTDILLPLSSVMEDQPPGTAVGMFTTADSDRLDTFTYTLIAGEGDADNASFTIDSIGDLLTGAAFNFHAKSTYSIRVRSTDQGDAWVEKAFTVTVTQLTGRRVDLVSTALLSSTGNGTSYTPSISADGRYVAFYSYASNLVSGDTNGYRDIFVKDVTTGVTTRLSTDSSAAQANNSSYDPSISADGRYVAFESYASNLHPWDTTTTQDVFRVSNFILDAEGPSLDVDGNGTVDALTDGILILRYLFDPTGPWNYTDAIGVDATRTTRADVKSFLDGGQTTMLDVDGNGTIDALTDGILILRYLFDRAGPWNYTDAIGVDATRTTRDAIRVFLDSYNPFLARPLDPQAGAFLAKPALPSAVTSTIDGSGLAPIPTVAAPSSTAVDVGESAGCVTVLVPAQVECAIQNSPVLVGTSNGDQLIAGVAPAVLLGGGTSACNTESIESASTLAQDTVLQEWKPSYSYDIPTARLPASDNSSTSEGDEQAVDELWGDGDLDWFLQTPDDRAVI